jgi:hypothetical protein
MDRSNVPILKSKLCHSATELMLCSPLTESGARDGAFMGTPEQLIK